MSAALAPPLAPGSIVNTGSNCTIRVCNPTTTTIGQIDNTNSDHAQLSYRPFQRQLQLMRYTSDTADPSDRATHPASKEDQQSMENEATNSKKKLQKKERKRINIELADLNSGFPPPG